MIFCPNASKGKRIQSDIGANRFISKANLPEMKLLIIPSVVSFQKPLKEDCLIIKVFLMKSFGQLAWFGITKLIAQLAQLRSQDSMV